MCRLHKASEMPEEFRREIEKKLSRREKRPKEKIYFKLHKNQIPGVDQAIEQLREFNAYVQICSDSEYSFCPGGGTERCSTSLTMKTGATKS